jgi:hypothetical protein
MANYRRRAVTTLCALVGACGLLIVSSGAAGTRRGLDGPQTCAGVVAGSNQATPTPGNPCWVEVSPYPFGADGTPVAGGCSAGSGGCLSVTSLAFRAWNRGLAITGGNSPYRVWLYNGTRWFPDPTFPGTSSCPGSKILWAGKLDYWVIEGNSAAHWSALCRFDGVNFLWQPLKVPAATLARVPLTGGAIKQGGITTGTCFSWDNCWFFGSFGTILHWDGKALSDASPDTKKQPGLAVEYLDSASATRPGGGAAGATVGKSEDQSGTPLPGLVPNGPPAELFTSTGTSWSSSSFTPPTLPRPADPSTGRPADPYRTDLVAVDVDADGRGWVAGNAAGWLLATASSGPSKLPRGVPDTPEPAPILPIEPNGADPDCATPSDDRFTHTGPSTLTPPVAPYPDSYSWTAISAVPGTGVAIAGGQLRPGSDDPLTPPPAHAYAPYEPVLVQVSCASTTFRVTRFLQPVPGTTTLVPIQPGGAVRALAANAVNDAWASTATHLYRLTDGQPPLAPAGDDNEFRPVQLQQDPPIFVFGPLPPPPPPPAAVVSATTKTLPPAIDEVKSKLRIKKVHGHATFTLYITFRVIRHVTLGAEAVRGSKVVVSTGLKTFTSGIGTLRLRLQRKSWPTAIKFLTDTPTVQLTVPPGALSGTVTLSASASAISGRHVASVRFDLSPAGTDGWTTIGTATAPPFMVKLDTSSVKTGVYDFRATVTDSADVAAISALVKNRQVEGAPAQ